MTNGIKYKRKQQLFDPKNLLPKNSMEEDRTGSCQKLTAGKKVIQHLVPIETPVQTNARRSYRRNKNWNNPHTNLKKCSAE